MSLGFISISIAKPVKVIDNNDGTVSPLLTINPPSGLLTLVECSSSYYESLSVPSAIETLIGIYTVPSGMISYISHIECSGSNIAQYRCEIDGQTLLKKRTMFGTDLNTSFSFEGSITNGKSYNAGSVLKVFAIHNRPYTGDFNSTIYYYEEPV